MTENKEIREMKTEEIQEKAENTENKTVQKRWFGRGIYGSKDVPIRLLDGFIGVTVAVIILLTIIFAVNGGYIISFDTDGGTKVDSQKLRYGELLTEPEPPGKPGYEFAGWQKENEPEELWNFAEDKVGGEMTLTALWIPAEITVKFDLSGGTVDGKEEIEPITVTYQETYGRLPVPQKEGAEFAGWLYSGQLVEADTVVSMTGEHVLTAVWE